MSGRGWKHASTGPRSGVHFCLQNCLNGAWITYCILHHTASGGCWAESALEGVECLSEMYLKIHNTVVAVDLNRMDDGIDFFDQPSLECTMRSVSKRPVGCARFKCCLGGLKGAVFAPPTTSPPPQRLHAPRETQVPPVCPEGAGYCVG